MRRLFLLFVVGLAACGGDEDTSDPLEFEHPNTKPLTACADASEADAFVLALRYQSDIPLNRHLVGDYTWALNNVRAVYPELCEPRAFADMSPDVLIVRPRDARIAAAWADGSIATGVAAIDDILDEVGVTEVALLPQNRSYQLTLAQPVNARALARKLGKTHLVDASAQDFEAAGEFYYDGREYVIRTPSDIEVKSGPKATRFVFNLKDGHGRRSVTIQHNGLIGSLDAR